MTPRQRAMEGVLARAFVSPGEFPSFWSQWVEDGTTESSATLPIWHQSSYFHLQTSSLGSPGVNLRNLRYSQLSVKLDL